MPRETPLTAETPQSTGATDAGTGQPPPVGSSGTATVATTSDQSLTVQVGLDRWRRMWPFKHQVSAWFASATLHATALIVLCLVAQHVIKHLIPVDLSVHTISHDEPLFENLPNEAPVAISKPRPGLPGAATASPDGDVLGSGLEDSPLGVPDLGAMPTPGIKVDSQPRIDPLATAMLPQGGGVSWGQELGKGGGGFGGRSPERRAQLVGSGGGSAASEDAVERGLRWLLAHQHEDGSWHFDFDGPPCDGMCRNPGTDKSTTAATALALLPFYGAGYTHKQGPYAEQVNKGLYYLGSRMVVTKQGGDLEEGIERSGIYAQGLATIVLCEAYGMSKDSNLRPYAQQAVNYILFCQDKKGGGWRYFPSQAGDTSVSGWQIMALKSALMAGLEVPSQSLFLANKFLDSVQADKGAYYGYLTPANGGTTTTSVGLLCRMYLGWGRNHVGLVAGAGALDKLGPSETNMYLNYYATQVMYHRSGPAWERWNSKMRDYLIAMQAKEGHENGSWNFQDYHCDRGGRLLNTALAILTLEVYYRYLPLYSTRAVDGGF